MEPALNTLSAIFGVIALVCWILVLVRLFQAGRTVPAVASLVLILCGIGPLIALIYGWVKARELRLTNIMTIWTVCLVGSILLGCAGGLIPRQIGI